MVIVKVSAQTECVAHGIRYWESCLVPGACICMNSTKKPDTHPLLR